jgi:dihydroorotate dehydrogenase (NAD+) catalytic subunit
MEYFYIDGKRCDVITNASGCNSRYHKQLIQLVDNGAQTIITKTCTLNKNAGNLQPNFKEINEHNSINCLGMPNEGFAYYRDLLPKFYNADITYIISMDASNWDELRIMLLDYDTFISNMKKSINCKDNCKELVEINASCPNKLDIINGATSRIIAYDPLELSRLLENIKHLDLQNINIGLKLSPYLDKILLSQIANVIVTYSRIVKYIVCGNSIPNGMIIDTTTQKPILSINTGGISGTANRLLGVSNVYQFNNIFNELFSGLFANKGLSSIVIIGCGGVETNNDILEYIAAGAKGVQIGRILYLDGVSRINSIRNSFNIHSNIHSKL